MKTRRLVSLALALVMMASVLLSATSCDMLFHKHNYRSVITPPTCITEGYTTHKCDCGDTKVDTRVPVTDHNYVAEVISYPTLTEDGSKKMVCAGCGKNYVEKIEALTASMPTLSDVLLAVFGELDYTISAEEGSTIIIIEEVDEESKYFQEKTYIALNVAEVNLDTTGEMAAGHIKLEFGIAVSSTEDREAELVEEFNEVGALYVYIANDVISIELVDFEGEKTTQEGNATVLFYTALGEILGIPEMPLAGMVNIIYGMSQLGPVIEKIQGDLEASDEYKAFMLENLEALSANLFTATVEEDGNTSYALNPTALSDFVAAITEKTLAEHIDLAYGEGTMASLEGLIKDLPRMTVREIADAAIEMAEAYGVTVEEIYQYIDNVIFYISGQPIDIEAQINLNAHLTVADIMIGLIAGDTSEMTKQEYNEMVDSIEATFADLADSISTLTLDQLYNLLAYGDIAYAPNEDGVVFSITESIKEGILSLSDMISVVFVVTPEGEIVYADVNVGFHFTYEKTDSAISADLVIEGVDYLDLNGVIADGVVTSLTLVIRDYLTTEVEVDHYDEENNYLYSETVTYSVFDTYLAITYNRTKVGTIGEKVGLTVQGGYAEMNADRTEAVAALDTILQVKATITKEEDKETITLEANTDELNELVGTVVLEAGKVVDCDLVFNVFNIIVDPETLEETTECVKIASVKYSDDLNGNIALDVVIDEAHVTLEYTTEVDAETGAESHSLKGGLYRILEDETEDQYLKLALDVENGCVDMFDLTIYGYQNETKRENLRIAYKVLENGAELYLALMDNALDIARETLEDGGYRITVHYDIDKVQVDETPEEVWVGTELQAIDNYEYDRYSFSDLVANEEGVYETIYGEKVYIPLYSSLAWLNYSSLDEYMYGADNEAYDELKTYADAEGNVPLTDTTIELLSNAMYDYYYIYYIYVEVETNVYETEYHYYYFSGEGTIVIESK